MVELVSIPLRKFRKYENPSIETGEMGVSIPLRKFRKKDAGESNPARVRCFHPSKEV